MPIFLDIMQENIAFTRTEAGMLQYDLTPDYLHPNVFFLLERFASRAALLAHIQSRHYQNCQQRFDAEMGEHPTVQICFYQMDPIEPSAQYTAAAEQQGHEPAVHQQHLQIQPPSDGTPAAPTPPPRVQSAPQHRALFDVSGQAVMVTGGASGLGRTIGEAFAAGGCRALFLLDIGDVTASAAELAAAHPEVLVRGLQCDVRDEAQVHCPVSPYTRDHGCEGEQSVTQCRRDGGVPGVCG